MCDGQAEGTEADAGPSPGPGLSPNLIPNFSLSLGRIDDSAYRVVTDRGLHIGNLKLIGGAWKFKAIGYDSNGGILPGWGPFTAFHNTTFAVPDPALINVTLVLA